jgi:cbb3-type cytochrome oxidase subunit 3
MRVAEAIIIIGVFACVLWYQYNKHVREINSFKQENAELLQQDQKLHDIIDEKYLVVKPKRLY